MEQEEIQPDNEIKKMLIKLLIFVGVAVITYFIVSGIISGYGEAYNE